MHLTELLPHLEAFTNSYQQPAEANATAELVVSRTVVNSVNRKRAIDAEEEIGSIRSSYEYMA